MNRTGTSQWLALALALGGLALAACKGGGDAPAAGGSGAAAKAVPAAGGSAGTAGSGAEGSAAAGPPPLSAKIKAARCGEPCLFLTDTPLGDLQDTYKAECGGMETKDLGFEDCDSLDYARNCIYAAHGLVFKKQKWKTLSKKEWYEARPEFKADTISPVEVANVSELNKRSKACRKGLRISGADFERLKKWFASAAAGKIPPAKKFFVEDLQPKQASDLATFLKEEVAHSQTEGKPRKLSLETGAMAEYEKPEEISVSLREAIGVPADAKLRSIRVELFDPATYGTEDEDSTFETTNLRFIYDEKDQLLAVDGSHFYND